MEIIDLVWMKILRHVEEAWQVGGACQSIPLPRAERLSLFTAVMSPADTFTTWLEVVHGYASRNELSDHLSTTVE